MHIPAPLLDMVGIQLEYRWDILNMLDGIIMRICVRILGYSFDIQHLDIN
jgi:hypothetical protein